MLSLALIGLVASYVLLYAGIKGTDPRDELLAVFRGGSPTPKLRSNLTGDSANPTPPVNGSGEWASSKSAAYRIASIAFDYGLKIVSEKRQTKSTATGTVSDHWVGMNYGYAYDLAGSKAQMDQAAVNIAKALEHSYTPGRQLYISRNVAGYRIQVIYWTMIGGNHYDHIHVGARKI